MTFSWTALVMAFLVLHAIPIKASNDIDEQVASVLERMETEVLSFRDELEQAYSKRCSVDTLDQCSENNFNDCTSGFPNEVCLGPGNLVITSCGSFCNGKIDRTTTAVRIPGDLADNPQGNPSDVDTIQSICYSRLAEPYMIENYNGESQMYFGSETGSFRIIPALHSDECGRYDPRRRPWYVAASSGPKDMVIVIDVSGSMNDYTRLDMAKEAVFSILDTLSVADRFSVVTFSDAAFHCDIGGRNSLIRATKDNKELIKVAVNALVADGATNFYDAFDTAFDVLDNTISNESTTGCNIAILFLTDGVITSGGNHGEVINLINNRTAQLAESFGRKTTIFSFSLGYEADHMTTKSISCNTDGIWIPVDDYSNDLIKVMISYYKYYAIGLGDGENDNFTAWVEPYNLWTGGKLGTSVSTPVYDRSVTPHSFLGVAAVDLRMDELEQILGYSADSSEILDRFVSRSTARCPKIDLSSTQLEALRFMVGVANSTCGGTNTSSLDFSGILPPKCAFESDLPNNLWNNSVHEGRTFTEYACCKGQAPDTCTAADTTTAAKSPRSMTTIIFPVVGTFVVVLLFICIRRHRNTDLAVMKQDSAIDENVTIIRSTCAEPSAPPCPPGEWHSK